MAIIKCKMCGGDIELAADKTFGTCEFCGSTMTLPKVDDDQRAALFNRGNHFRRIGEFDKALAVYEQIIRDQDADAEAHWCCALCRFGIEYVEDPVTYEYLPTCHRASFDSFLEDVDYKAALEYSDGITHRQYMKDGAKIAEVQRGILATSQNAEPYDVFICYKESDDNGGRTRDSLLAQDIYYQLTEQGRKIFFSRITLEDVAGTQYEPYIFAALNSAKVMIVVGTKPEYLHAVWVKNEWSRFLAMMKKDRSKLLLPCYRDMDPYDMPEQLGVLQSYDMSKIGFIQDLTRGIAKVLDAEKTPTTVKETVVVQQSAAPTGNTAPLLKRVFLFLEDGDWNSANEYCEKVLDMDPECAQAYLGKLMAELKVSKQYDLKNQAKSFSKNNNYQKALRFADKELKNTLAGYITHIETRNEHARRDAILANAKEKMGLHSIRGYMAAMELFQSIPGWKDADKQFAACQEKIEVLKAEQEAKRAEREQQAKAVRTEIRKKSKRSLKAMGCFLAVILIIGIGVAGLTRATPLFRYLNAVNLAENGQHEEALAVFNTLDGFLDSEEYISLCETSILDRKYDAARYLFVDGYYEEALKAFQELGDYQASKAFIANCENAILNNQYYAANRSMESGMYKEAIAIYADLNGYWDSYEKILECGDYIENVLDKRREVGQVAIAYYKSGNKEKSLEIWDTVAARDTVASSYQHTVALKNNGTVVATGSNTDDYGNYIGPNGPCDVYGWNDIVAVSAGSGFTIGLKSDGTVVATGSNDMGQCNVDDWKDIVSISTGDWFTMGLKADGTVVCTGTRPELRSVENIVKGWENIVAIAAGANDAVGLRADGTVVCTFITNTKHDDMISVDVGHSSGYPYFVGLTSDRSVVIRGEDKETVDSLYSATQWKDIVSVQVAYFSVAGICKDGTVVSAFANDKYSQMEPLDLSKWTDIVAVIPGYFFVVGLRSNGTAVAVGDNSNNRSNVTEWQGIGMP